MTRIRTLIVDDEPIARARVLSLLREEPDVDVVGECGSGTQAVSAIKSTSPDLVFLDYMMPVMDGAEVLSAMAGDPSVAKVPVVLMSSMPEATVAERCSGYTAFMRKPFKIAQVVTLTVKLLNRDGPDGQGAL